MSKQKSSARRGETRREKLSEKLSEKRSEKRRVQRVQTGVRVEKGILKVLKGLAEYLDMTLGDLLEGIVLHTFEGKTPFSPETLAVIERLKGVYGLELTAADSHHLVED